MGIHSFRDHFPPFKEEIICDVGVHIGIYTMILARNVGRKGLVIVIEPHARNYYELVTNMSLNKLTNVILIRCAVNDRSVYADLYPSNGSAWHSITKGARKP